MKVFPFQPLSDLDVLIYLFVFTIFYFWKFHFWINATFAKFFGRVFGSSFFPKLSPLVFFYIAIFFALAQINVLLWAEVR